MPKSIMVIDDSAVARGSLRRDLEESGYQVSVARNAEDALVWMRGNPAVDAIITDYHMPGMSGEDLVRRLRSSTTYRSVPILVLTGTGASTAKDGSRSAGATGWIVKPHSKDKLTAALRQLLV